jgi:nitrate reductase gamma subunit
MRMSFAHWVAYGALVVFVFAVAVRYFRIRGYPLNVRWEIYPIPHEGERFAHGGSKLEETDWWTRPHAPSRSTELRFMLPEMIFLKGLWDHNRKLWWRSFPFHFGLYLCAGFVGLLLLGAALELAGISVRLGGGGAGGLLAVSTVAVGVGGLCIGLVGGAGLLLARLTDRDLKPYTTASHYFNLVFIMTVEALGLATFWTVDPDFALCRGFARGLLTFRAPAVAGESALLATTLTVAALLVAYIPLTHMSHFFVKWFTWHGIRWDDEANVRGGRIEVMIQQALAYPVGWSAGHIGAERNATWAEVATKETPQ